MTMTTLFQASNEHRHKTIFNLNTLALGADRTEYAALKPLNIIGSILQSSLPLPLLWSQHEATISGAFEVYPPETIISHGLNGTGYRGIKPRNINARGELFDSLS